MFYWYTRHFFATNRSKAIQTSLHCFLIKKNNIKRKFEKIHIKNISQFTRKTFNKCNNTTIKKNPRKWISTTTKQPTNPYQKKQKKLFGLLVRRNRSRTACCRTAKTTNPKCRWRWACRKCRDSRAAQTVKTVKNVRLFAGVGWMVGLVDNALKRLETVFKSFQPHFHSILTLFPLNFNPISTLFPRYFHSISTYIERLQHAPVDHVAHAEQPRSTRRRHQTTVGRTRAHQKQIVAVLPRGAWVRSGEREQQRTRRLRCCAVCADRQVVLLCSVRG